MSQSKEVQEILARGRITADDVLSLRHRVFWKGVVTSADAEMAFDLNDKLGIDADSTWPLFFVEALTGYVVYQAQPAGYVSEENADWLIKRISRSNCVDTETELELLIKIMERSKQSPVKLVRFALEQVKWAVLHGEGYVGKSRKLTPGVVGEPEVELLRRMLYAFGGDGNIAITRQEAEVLFDINDATSEADNHPAWSDLFVKAVANFLMASSGYQVPNRQEALRREAWLDTPTAGIGRFMTQMLSGSLNAVWEAYRQGSIHGEPRGNPNLALNDSPRVTEEEAHWAADRIGRDGLHANEVALIEFLKNRGAHLHPKLRPILEKAA